MVEAARELGATLLGAEPRRAGTLNDQLTRTTADQWAVSALSVALDDLRARQLGIAVADLYGGRRRNTVRTDLLAEPLEVRDGRVAIPSGPGLGIEVDESAVRALDRLATGG